MSGDQPQAGQERPQDSVATTEAPPAADRRHTDTPAAEAPAAEAPAAESSPTQTQPPAAESAAQSASAPDAAPSAETEAASTEPTTEQTPRRRVQLNPTASPEMARPVPTYAASEPAAGASGVTRPPDVARGIEREAPSEAEQRDEAELAEQIRTAAKEHEAAITSGSTRVELPPKKMELGADLEAEIEAAMRGDAQTVAPTEGAPTAVPTQVTEETLEPGAKLQAKVQSLTGEEVFLDLGFRSPGVVQLRQFPQGRQPQVGETFEVLVDRVDPEQGLIHASLPKATRRVRGNWEELSVGQVVECIVSKTNKGGLEVTIGGLRAFLPASQVDLGFVSNLDSYVGQKFPVKITEVKPAKRNLVVSRRALLQEERREAGAKFWEQVETGQRYTGTVKTIKDYGVFVDLGGADGFLHIGEMSWTRLNHPSDLLQEGQAIEVTVLQVDQEKHKISLGMKQLVQNPWATIEQRYEKGKTVSGRVTRTTDFGAFIELEPGVEGLVHISELDYKRVRRVTDVLNVGQDVDAQVLEVDPGRKRISLSLKALKPKPEAERPPADEDLSPGRGAGYERKRKEPLRGGTTNQPRGGLFGNPSDYGR